MGVVRMLSSGIFHCITEESVSILFEGIVTQKKKLSIHILWSHSAFLKTFLLGMNEWSRYLWTFFSPLMLYCMFTEIQACSGLLHCLLHPVIQFTVGCDDAKLYCSHLASIMNRIKYMLCFLNEKFPNTNFAFVRS
jgi:hypothetical protein